MNLNFLIILQWTTINAIKSICWRKQNICMLMCMLWYVYAFIYTYICNYTHIKSFPGGASGKESACQCKGHKRAQFDPWVGKIPRRRKWQPTPLFLLGECHRQRSLEGYSPWGCKEVDTTEVTLHACMHIHI